MTPNSTLEIKGRTETHSITEVAAEIAFNALTGALRAGNESNKAILYFVEGKLVNAVSNARKHRLFDMLLRQGRITPEDLARHPQFSVDHEFVKSLLEQNVIKKDEADILFSKQVDNIVLDTIEWTAGEWSFDPRARSRTEVANNFDLVKMLVNNSRKLSVNYLLAAFNNTSEFFSGTGKSLESFIPETHESFILSYFTETRSLRELLNFGGIAEQNVLQAVYTLWLLGSLERSGKKRAFSAENAEAIKAAVFTKKNDVRQDQATPAIQPKPQTIEPEQKAAELAISLDDYLKRMQNAASHYDVLGLERNASLNDIKQTYFGLAKLFHPDKFHRQTPQLLRSIQMAFTSLSQAYETLKQPETRQTYDFKLKKEETLRSQRIAEGKAEITTDEKLAEGGTESYRQGLELLKDKKYDEAATHFARAVHYAPGNAIYHAYYAQALSYDDKSIRKAEAEFQTAIKMEPGNEEIRLMLVEFFMDINMSKRAEGELKRFLEIVPNSAKAKQMLAQIQQ